MISWGSERFGFFEHAMEIASLQIRSLIHLSLTIYLQPEHSYWMAQAAATSRLLLFIYNANVTHAPPTSSEGEKLEILPK